MTTPDIHCINILCNGPNGNVQLVYSDFISANTNYQRVINAIEGAESFVPLTDAYGQKCYIRTSAIDSILLNDTAASLRGASEIGLLNDVAKVQYQNRAMQHPAMKAAGMMRNLANGLGPANG